MVCSVVYQWRWASSHQGAMRLMVAWFKRYAHVMTTPAHKSVHTNRPSTETPLRYQIRVGSKTREPWPQEVCHHGTLRWHFDASSFPGSKIRVNICYESYYPMNYNVTLLVHGSFLGCQIISCFFLFLVQWWICPWDMIVRESDHGMLMTCWIHGWFMTGW